MPVINSDARWYVIKTARFKENYVGGQLDAIAGSEAYGPLAKLPKLFLKRGQGHLETMFPGEFHTVLMDTPPMLHLPDARVLGQRADGVVLVLRSSYTSREHAVLAAQGLKEDGTPVAGSTPNQWEPEGAQRRCYGYYKESSNLPARSRASGELRRP